MSDPKSDLNLPMWDEVRMLRNSSDATLEWKLHIQRCVPYMAEFGVGAERLIGDVTSYLVRYYPLYTLSPKVEWLTVGLTTMAPIREVGASGAPATRGPKPLKSPSDLITTPVMN